MYHKNMLVVQLRAGDLYITTNLFARYRVAAKVYVGVRNRRCSRLGRRGWRNWYIGRRRWRFSRRLGRRGCWYAGGHRRRLWRCGAGRRRRLGAGHGGQRRGHGEIFSHTRRDLVGVGNGLAAACGDRPDACDHAQTGYQAYLVSHWTLASGDLLIGNTLIGLTTLFDDVVQ